MRWIWRLFADAPPGQPHPLQDRLGEEEGKAPIELRPQVPAQHLFVRPGNRPFRAFGVGHGVGIGHVAIGEQDENTAQATVGRAA